MKRSCPRRHQTAHKIGALCLEVPPDRFPGSLSDPTIFPVPMLYETVEGAWVDAILASDPALIDPVIRAAKRLEQRGATLLISNCGFFIHYRPALQKQVSVPAAISSLLWLPHLNQMRSAGGKIGIVTYDSIKLNMAHLRAAWPDLDPDAIAIAGLEGTRTWRDAGLKDSIYDFDQIWEDLRTLLDRLVDAHPAVQLILVECVTLCAFVPLIKRHLGLPTYDIVALARSWLDGLDAGGTFSDHVRPNA
ncbi:MAG: hypothetical protein HC869_03655 [Rhodospirillales bacterium]|nr:hypothetical protein [Rhodospirillales bacterium]